MPFEIVRNDITKMKVDAIVNPVNPFPSIGAGTDVSIHVAAGPELLKVRQDIGVIPVGTSVITAGFELNAKYVIHVANPIWIDGNRGEEQKLYQSYESALEQANIHKCKSVAFPLLSSGAYKFPKSRALQIAIESFTKFLMMNDMTIYLVVYNREAYGLSKKLFDEVPDYLEENYVEKDNLEFALFNDDFYYEGNQQKWGHFFEACKEDFNTLLINKIIKSEKTDPEIYRAANMSRQSYHRVINTKGHSPKKDTVIVLAMALELNLEETKQLLERAGYALNPSDPRDIVFEKCIMNKKYNVYKLQYLLEDLGLDQISLKKSK